MDAEIFFLYLLNYTLNPSWAYSTMYDNCDKMNELQSQRSDCRYTPQIDNY